MTPLVPCDVSLIPRSAGWLLTLGAIVFWLGAVTPPYRQWTGVPLDEYLRIVAAHRLNWYVMHGLFAAGTVITLAGLAGVHAALSVARTQIWSGVGSTLWLTAAALWLVCIAHRVTMTVWAAESSAGTGAILSVYAAVHSWMSLLFGAHMLLSYLALAAFGIALHQTASLPRWVAHVVLAFGFLGVPGLATPLFQPPLMVFVAPFLVSVAILRAPQV